MGVPPNWDAPGASYTWQYNLHYFDCLHQPGIGKSVCLELIQDWIRRYPYADATGWEPYPVSLRLVNWIKFCSNLQDLPETIVKSVRTQASCLSRRVEYHIMGNHLFTNGKALMFAGIFLGDRKLLGQGRKIVLKEIDEQFCPDGGHFELSPMYHAIVLEDILDLMNLLDSSGISGFDREKESLARIARRALGWLGTIADGTGRIPLLNDSAHGIARPYGVLKEYASRLGVDPDTGGIEKSRIGGWTAHNLSGYRIFSDKRMRIVFDTAMLGPDYQPGHAHCDMLSILLDFDGEPVFTDTGVYEYTHTKRRTYSRSATAHNTVVADGLDQAEIWASFRMGRRGRPTGYFASDRSIGCGHDGFRIGGKKIFHHRTISLLENGFELTDRLAGPSRHRFESFFHVAPGVCAEPDGRGGFVIGGKLKIRPMGAFMEIGESEYYPEFGTVLKRPCLVMNGHFNKQTSFGMRCTYFS